MDINKSNIIKKTFFSSYVRAIVTFYAGFTLLGGLLLMLPISLTNNHKLSFIDAIFISASGMSTTGLSTVNVSEVFTRFGQVILALILQFGGIGLMLIIAGFWIIIGKKITLKERSMVVTDQNQLKTGGVIKLVKETLILILLIEAIGFLILSSYLWLKGYFELKEAIFQAFFLTISMFTNAGFDITGDSLVRYANDYVILSTAIVLIFLGGVGFWTLVEFKHFINAKINKKKFNFSIYVKLIFKMHLFMVIFGAILFGLFEYNNFLSDKSFIESVYYSLFMSTSTRSAGFVTLDMNKLTAQTLWLFNGLMFIGSAPNSTGGGIRTTTFFVVITALHSFAIGREQVVVYKKAIKEKTVIKCLMVLVGATIIVYSSIWLVTMFEPKFSLLAISLEVFSAFGTTGLSLGITPELSIISKIVLIITMFIGRIGIISLLLFFKDDNAAKNRIKYPEIDLIIG